MKYSNNKMLSLSRQQGAALVVALLIVMVVVSLSVSVSGDFFRLFRQVENQSHGQQATALLMAAEGMARKVIGNDPELSFDHAKEGWLQQSMTLPHEHGVLQGVLSDEEGRLNINNLRNDDATSLNTDQARFIRLLQTLDLPQPLTLPEAESIANAVFDWLDSDDQERMPGGAENLYYGSADLPGRAANNVMASVSELRWVKGISAEIYQALRPHITVFGRGVLNVNTASQALLRSINAVGNLLPLEPADVETWLEEQQAEQIGFEKLADFPGGSFTGMTLDVGGLDVVSHTFRLQAQMRFLDRDYWLFSIIKRDVSANTLTVIARSKSSFE